MLNSFPAPSATHICLGICTYQRPEMLLRCLLSVRKLKAPHGTRLSVVVVENEVLALSRTVVLSYSGEDSGLFHYVHQPMRGIAQARNAILDKADQLGANWVAMLDDDQAVKPDWLQWMWEAVRLEEADIVQGHTEQELPAQLPRWAFPKPQKKRDWKTDVTHAATNGVLFRNPLSDDFGAPLRFDEQFALTGGEDRDFFSRATWAGYRIVWTPEAVATEFVPASKLTFGAQVARAYSGAVVAAMQDRSYYGFLPAYIAKSIKITLWGFHGVLAIASVPFAVFGGAGRKQLLTGAKHIARAAGTCVGLCGAHRPQPYRTIHGR